MSANGDHESHDISNNSGASSTVVRHFEQNFELSGFGSPGEALVVSRLPGVFCGTSFFSAIGFGADGYDNVILRIES